MFLHKYTNPYLPLGVRLWPLLIRVNLLCVTLSFVLWVSYKVSVLYLVRLVSLLGLISFIWWRDVIRERILGFHTSKLEYSFRTGILWFITSEVFFFISFFWSFYDRSLAPSIELGITWPPVGVLPLSVYSVPLLNTVILLSSGVTITWAHHSLINNYYTSAVVGLLVTVFLGLYFLFIQYQEYMERAFSICDGIYGTTFFIRTGFHGMHVIVGTSILLYTLYTILLGKFLANHHFMFEASAWYWHFVDVVWLFLYISIYWWGSL